MDSVASLAKYRHINSLIDIIADVAIKEQWNENILKEKIAKIFS